MQSQNDLTALLNDLVHSIRVMLGTDAEHSELVTPQSQMRSFFSTLTPAQVQTALENIHAEKVEQQTKSAAQAGRPKYDQSGWFGALIRYGARCQEMQNRAIYFQMSYTAHRSLKNRLAQGVDRWALQYAAGPDFSNPYRGPSTSQAVITGDWMNDRSTQNYELLRRGWDPSPQSNFLTESAPVVILDEQKNRVSLKDFSYPSGIPTSLWIESKESLGYDPFFTWFSPGTMVRRHVQHMRNLGIHNRCWSERFTNSSVDKFNPILVVKPGWWKSTGEAYRDRLLRYLHIARWCVWSVEQARMNARVNLTTPWQTYCTQWGIGTLPDARALTGHFERLDKYGEKLAMVQSPDEYWRQTHPREDVALHLASSGMLQIAPETVKAWQSAIMLSTPSPWKDSTPIMEDRRLCDIPPDAASLLPPVWVRAQQMTARIESMTSYENAKKMDELQEAAFARAVTGMTVKIAIAIIVTAATWGGGAPAGGAMIGSGVAQIAAACKDLVQGGVSAAVSLIQTAIETYGPALVQRLINRALQATDINIDIPNLADCISQGLPVVGDDTLQATGARLRASIAGVTQSGYDYLGDLGGNLIDTGGRYVPDVPEFVERFKL